MATFSEFLRSLDSTSKGQQFENFVKWFLTNDPWWSTQVDEVWLWYEYPKKWGRDCGVDLIFKHKNGETWAVQAKCYSSDYYVTKQDVDKFLSESNRKGIDKRLLIATTDRIGTNAKKVLEGQEKPVISYLYSDFDTAAIEYPESLADLKPGHQKEKPKIRDHQLEAVDAVENGFKKSERGQLIMACGTGKTFTTLWIKERLRSNSVLVLLPSLSLLSQTLREWTFASSETFDVLCVCSDDSVGKQDNDEIFRSVKNVPFPVESDAESIAHFLSNDGKKVVFSTYQSSPLIADAQLSLSVPAFDLVIADEAHRCTGEIGNAFTTVLDSERIRAHKRLFTTATPRTFSPNHKKKGSERGINVSGMDDESVFGKVLFELNFGEAIKRELLTDYQVVIICVDQPMIAKWIRRREIIRTESGETTDAKSLASQIGLIKAIKDYDLKRIISFHSRVKRAEKFSNDIQDSIKYVNQGVQGKQEMWSDYVSGAMTTYDRRLKLEQLRKLPNADRGILSNARCLAEGVDVPSLDGVAFIDPRSSQIDIVQIVGRGIRKSDNKKIGTIILPVFIENGDDPDAAIESSNFKQIWSVLTALKSHDDVLSFELDNLRTKMGRDDASNLASGSFSKIVFDLPETVDQTFSDSIRTCVVEKTTSSWNFWFGLLEKYVEDNGNANVSFRYKTEHEHSLGTWVRNQRATKDGISSERISKLDSLGFDWDTIATRWNIGFAYFEIFVKEHGNAKVHAKYKTENGVNLGAWLSAQRVNKDNLSSERISKLDSLGFDWDQIATQWNIGFAYFEIYVKEKGDSNVPLRYKTEDGVNLGAWLSSQRANKDNLTSERISKLDSLGFDWDPIGKRWNKGFAYFEIFVKKRGHAKVRAQYKTEDEFNLGKWLSDQRKNKANISSERIFKLDSLGFNWDPIIVSQWNNAFAYFEIFVKEQGHSKVRTQYKAEDGFNLGAWLSAQRIKKDKLSSERISKLDSLGFDWDLIAAQWNNGFAYFEIYVKEKGDSKVPLLFKTEDEFKLGNWVGGNRRNKSKLSSEQISKLESLEFDWDTIDTRWNNGFAYFELFVKEQGHAKVHAHYKTEDEYNLGKWVSVQRSKKDNLSSERISKLDSLDFDWDPTETHWNNRFAYFEVFVKEKGHVNVPYSYKTEDGINVGVWVHAQRKNKADISSERIFKLDSLGFNWGP